MESKPLRLNQFKSSHDFQDACSMWNMVVCAILEKIADTFKHWFVWLSTWLALVVFRNSFQCARPWCAWVSKVSIRCDARRCDTKHNHSIFVLRWMYRNQLVCRLTHLGHQAIELTNLVAALLLINVPIAIDVLVLSAYTHTHTAFWCALHKFAILWTPF